MQELGLQVAYSENDTVYSFIRKLMALPLLPHHEMPRKFRQLKLQAADSRPLRKLTTYVKRQWIENALLVAKGLERLPATNPHKLTMTSKAGINPGGGGGGTPYNGLYGEAPPERGTFFRLEVCERVGISRVQVWEMVGKTAI